MSFFQCLYTLLIGPLELLFEVLFSLSYRILHRPGLCIIAISLAMNFLVLPLYRRADKIQEEERAQREKMRRWTEHIKKTFKGDERFMMLQTYQRQNGYKPTDALKGSVSLLLEIPFFIAAYQFLSHLQVLQGVSFGPIRDLGLPDALLSIAGTSINVLPILMTVINLASAAIYMKGMPKANKIQMVGLAVIFLVFLYQSPAGLVFYWTLNNVFSLCKNIFYKLKNPGRVLAALASAVGLAGLLALAVLRPGLSRRQLIFVTAVLLALQIPALMQFLLKKRGMAPRLRGALSVSEKGAQQIFFGSALSLAVMTGFWIPSTVVKASPAEFVSLIDYSSPLWFVLGAFLLAAGTFLVWCGIFYWLASKEGKKIFSLVLFIGAIFAIVDFLFFGTHYGQLTAALRFEEFPVFLKRDMLINTLALALLALFVFLLWKKKERAAAVTAGTIALAISVLSITNAVSIRQTLQPTKQLAEEAMGEKATIPLSKNGKNVIVLMMDRGMGYFVPFLLEEKPELKAQWDGFTWYPNTLSYCDYTIGGVAGVYGGYEYIPEEMNRRKEERLPEKQNEALKVMPVLFLNHGFKVTVCDPTYANFQWIPDLSIYDDYPEIRRFITMQGQFTLEQFTHGANTWAKQKKKNRDFFSYGLFKTAPVLLQPTLYAADYNAMMTTDLASQTNPGVHIEAQTMYSTTVAEGLREDFLRSYAVLNHLPEITTIEDTEENTFLMMSNDTTHDPLILQEPDYEPAWRVDNTAYEEAIGVRQDGKGDTFFTTDGMWTAFYHINMAAFLKLGDWFDYLREEGVYDNTRIIVVSDHAVQRNLRSDLLFSYTVEGTGKEESVPLTHFQPMLLVKDFADGTGEGDVRIDERFMTNADTPILAMKDLIEEPVNPFTEKAIVDTQKEEPEQHVMVIQEWDIEKNNGTTYMPTSWLAVKEDVRKPENWSYIGEK